MLDFSKKLEYVTGDGGHEIVEEVTSVVFHDELTAIVNINIGNGPSVRRVVDEPHTRLRNVKEYLSVDEVIRRIWEDYGTRGITPDRISPNMLKASLVELGILDLDRTYEI